MELQNAQKTRLVTFTNKQDVANLIQQVVDGEEVSLDVSDLLDNGLDALRRVNDFVQTACYHSHPADLPFAKACRECGSISGITSMKAILRPLKCRNNDYDPMGIRLYITFVSKYHCSDNTVQYSATFDIFFKNDKSALFTRRGSKQIHTQKIKPVDSCLSEFRGKVYRVFNRFFDDEE